MSLPQLEPQIKQSKISSFFNWLWTDRYFWIAIILTLVLRTYSDIKWLLWPISQFGTYVHELFHGLFAILGGGSFERMTLYATGGGTAFTASYATIPRAMISVGGLIGPSILGGIILFLSRRYKVTHYLLRGLAIFIAISTLLWVRDWYTFQFCAIACAIISGVSFIPNKTTVRIFAQFIAIQLCLENLIDFDYMFTESFIRDGQQLSSDTANIAEVMGGNYFFWGCIIAAITLVIIFTSLIKSRPST